MKLKEILERFGWNYLATIHKTGQLGLSPEMRNTRRMEEISKAISQIRTELKEIREEFEKKFWKNPFGFATSMEMLDEKIDKFCEGE